MKRKRSIQPWTPFQRGTFTPEYQARCRELGAPIEEVWLNSRYQVAVRHLVSEDGQDTITHLSVKRRDKSPIRDWRDLQRIKNELCGPEREGFEMFPAESRLVDTANQYDIWVLPEGKSLGVGWHERLVAEGSIGGSKQRDFDDDARPFDTLPAQTLDEMEQAKLHGKTTEWERELATRLAAVAVKLRYGVASPDDLLEIRDTITNRPQGDK